MNFSWDSDFRLEYYLFNYLMIFNYLEENEFQYLILSDQSTILKTEAEKYIDIENELLVKFYENFLY